MELDTIRVQLHDSDKWLTPVLGPTPYFLMKVDFDNSNPENPTAFPVFHLGGGVGIDADGNFDAMGGLKTVRDLISLALDAEQVEDVSDNA